MSLLSPVSPGYSVTYYTRHSETNKPTWEIVTILTPISIPNAMSSLSLTDTAGRSTGVPGRLQPFLLPSEPPFSTSHRIMSPKIIKTVTLYYVSPTCRVTLCSVIHLYMYLAGVIPHNTVPALTLKFSLAHLFIDYYMDYYILQKIK